MNVRFVMSPILALSLSFHAAGQQVSRGDSEGGLTVRGADAGLDSKEKLLHRIAMDEAAVRNAESTHAGNVHLGVLYAELGLEYEDAAQFERAEAALQRSVSLLRHAPDAGPNLPSAISQLGSLHVAMRKFRESEDEEQEALRLRLNLGDRLKIARSWNDLAALYLAEHKIDKARDYAQKALDEFKVNEKAAVIDKLSARYALAMAFCYLKECASAIPLLKDAVEEAKAMLQPGAFPIGFGNFLLGYAYWKCGNMLDAGPQFQEGTTAMSVQLGWGHPAYLAALRQYATFLKQNKQKDVANAVELRIRQAESVVDVHSIQSSQGMFGINGLR
jgi:tetratricopeptide (TPR) repeat protein